MAADIISILDHLSLHTVIGIAHDWGTYLLSQLAIWYPERFEKLVFFSVPFSPPGRELDVKRINEVTKRKSGFEQYGYQVFFASDGAGKIIGKNVCPQPHISASFFPFRRDLSFISVSGKLIFVQTQWEKFFHSIFHLDPKYWTTHLAPLGGLKAQLESEGELVPLAGYISETDKAHHHAAFGDDYEAPCRWYVGFPCGGGWLVLRCIERFVLLIL
jgi:pimeloyl-ACP methyl ester carboxylesterase